jgi:hypothetical protein
MVEHIPNKNIHVKIWNFEWEMENKHDDALVINFFLFYGKFQCILSLNTSLDVII